MSRSVENLSFKHQDSSLDPQHSGKSCAKWHFVYNPCDWTGRYQALATPVLVCSGPSDPASKKGGKQRRNMPNIDLWSVHTCTYMFISTIYKKNSNKKPQDIYWVLKNKQGRTGERKRSEDRGGLTKANAIFKSFMKIHYLVN